MSKNFATSLLTNAPGTGGTSVTVTTGTGSRFIVGLATVGPDATTWTPANAEVVTITSVSTDTLTVTRQSESSTAMALAAGYRIVQGVTAGMWDGITGASTVVAAPTGVAATDYANITAALTAVTTLGGIVQLQPGIYKTTQTIVVPGGVMLRGTGIDYAQTAVAAGRAAVIVASGSITGPVVQVGNYFGTAADSASFLSGRTGATIQDLVVDGAGLASYAVQTYGARSYVRACQIYRGTTYALYHHGQNSYVLDSVIGQNDVGSTIYIDNDDNKVINCQVRGHGSAAGSNAGIKVFNGATYIANNHIFPNASGISSGGPDIHVVDSSMVQILGNDLDQTNNPGIHLESVSSTMYDIQIVGNVIRNYTSLTDITHDAIKMTCANPIKGVTVVGNTVRAEASHKYRSIVGRTGANPALVNMVGNHAEYCSALSNGTPTLEGQSANTVYDGSSTKYTDKGGTSTQSGTGAQTAFTIAHGLIATPSKWSVTAQSAAAATPFYVTADATNLTVTYTTAPASGTNNVVLTWLARV